MQILYSIATRAADVTKLRPPARLRQTNWRVLHIPVLSECKNGVFKQYFLETFTTDVRQPWTNYVNNGNKHLIVGADVRSEYSNIRYVHLIIGKAQKFVSGDKYDF